MRRVLGALFSVERASLEEEGGSGRYEKGSDDSRSDRTEGKGWFGSQAEDGRTRGAGFGRQVKRFGQQVKGQGGTSTERPGIFAFHVLTFHVAGLLFRRTLPFLSQHQTDHLGDFTRTRTDISPPAEGIYQLLSSSGSTAIALVFIHTHTHYAVRKVILAYLVCEGWSMAWKKRVAALAGSMAQKPRPTCVASLSGAPLQKGLVYFCMHKTLPI